jgi:hypothetical protein
VVEKPRVRTEAGRGFPAGTADFHRILGRTTVFFGFFDHPRVAAGIICGVEWGEDKKGVFRCGSP